MQSHIMRGTLPQVRWGAIFAGVALALASHVCLGLFGAALGFAAQGNDSRALGLVAGLWSLLSAFFSSLLGALLACRLAGADEDRGAWLHGLMVWSFGLVAGALFLSGTLAGTAMGTSYIWNGGLIANDAALDGGPGSAIDSAARDAAGASLLGGIAALAGLAGAIAGATLGRQAVAQAATAPRATAAVPVTATERRTEATYAPGMMPPPSVERRHQGAIDTIWSDPAFERRHSAAADRRRH